MAGTPPQPSNNPPRRPTTSFSSLPQLSKPFLLDPTARSYRHQYSNIYFVRLVELRPIVEERAKERWGGIRGELTTPPPCLASPMLGELGLADVEISLGKPPLLPRILNLQRSQLCYIVGTVYLDMPMKPNVLEDMARDVRLISASMAYELKLGECSTG